MYYECNSNCNGMFALILFVSQKRFISLFQNTFFIPRICPPPPPPLPNPGNKPPIYKPTQKPL